jgi:hypothetical protein
MPLAAILNLSLIEAMAKSGTISASGRSTATSATSCSTISGNIAPGNDYALLAKLQGITIHAPPGPCPICASTQPITKTQEHAECKAKKEAKAKAAKNKKHAVAVRRTKALARKQEKQESLLSAAEAKAARAVAKAKELRAAADKTLVCTTAANSPHSHKKSKGNAGAPYPGLVGFPVLQWSPQQKTVSAYKRVSVHSPFCSLIRHLSAAGEHFSSEGSYALDTSKDDSLAVGNDLSESTDSNLEPILLISTSRRKFCIAKDKRLLVEDPGTALPWFGTATGQSL